MATAVDAAEANEVAPLEPVDLGGNSHDVVEYTQQLFAIQAGAEVENPDSWPSEALITSWRAQTIVQYVASIVGSGPRWHPDHPLLTNAQVVWAQNAYSGIAGMLSLHPAYADALDRASRIAEKHAAQAPLPWPTNKGQTWPFKRVYASPLGSAVISGYYGTGHGTLK